MSTALNCALFPNMKQSRLLHNIVSLGTLQIVNSVSLLATIPFVTRALGVVLWGKVTFVLLVINYLLWMTNWGFPFSATRKIAMNRDDTLARSEIFMATWVGQWILAVLVIIVLMGLLAFAPFFSAYRALYIYGIGLIVGTVLFPSWFLTGLEMMKELALFQSIPQILSVPAIILLVRHPKDASLYIGINAAVSLLSGLLALIWIQSKLHIRWSFPGFGSVYEELKDGSALFASAMWNNLYIKITPTALGILAGPAALGIFNLASRPLGLARSVLTPINNAVFPRMSRLYVRDHANAARILRLSGAIITLVCAAISFSLLLFAHPIVSFLGGAKFEQSAGVLRWLSPFPLAMGLAFFFGFQVMIPAGKIKAYTKIIAAAGCLNLIAIFPLVRWMGVDGAAIAMLLMESFAAIAMFFYSKRNGFFLYRGSVQNAASNIPEVTVPGE